ncbi:hypothetical protein BG015_009590 [Linnemannia schmuckeri]|uniref:Helicase C-terminal domain-containing protein n=1 Tax=Linnemannia schmuckeri TaxID=64567 RepID=A0A9P5S5N2_9FUNG|nr:hypothetical protein BG015_009590 [Linnemannia schmuckeri]
MAASASSPNPISQLSWISFPNIVTAACSPCSDCQHTPSTSKARKHDDSLHLHVDAASSKRRLVKDKVLHVGPSAAGYPQMDPYMRSNRRRDDWLLVNQWQEVLSPFSYSQPCQHQLDRYVNTALRFICQEGIVLLLLGDDILCMRSDKPTDNIWAPHETTTTAHTATVFAAFASLQVLDKSAFSLVPLLSVSEPDLGISICFNVFLKRSTLSEDLFPRGIDRATQEFLHFVFPHPTAQCSSTFSDDPIKDLYTHLKSSAIEAPQGIQPEKLIPQLLPFQQRSVAWCLRRESRDVKNGAVEYREPTPAEKLPLSWELVSTPSGEQLAINRLYGSVCLYNHIAVYASSEPRGGILAEEMGLGKTVEMLALILLNRRNLDRSKSEITIHPKDNLEQRMLNTHLEDRHLEASTAESQDGLPISRTLPLIKSAATLIITPPSILHQWASEIENHAPSLRVFLYIDSAPSTISAEELARYDIVLTTYAVLSKEIHYANQYDRPRRHDRRYCPRTSPVAQLIEGASTSQAAAMSHLIPRVMSWAVSGTPVKRNVDDLYSLLQFLKQGPIAFDKRVQKLLKERHFRPTFVSCFQSVMHRYAKQEVAHEHILPAQYRMVYGIDFTHVERTNYMDKWEQCLAECNFNIADDTSAEADGLQSWLIRLRQTCCHPQIGSRNMEALGRTNLRTIDEVLNAMVRQAALDLYIQEKGLVNTRIKRAVLQARINKDEQELALFHSIDKEISRHVALWKEKLAEEATKKDHRRAALTYRRGDGQVGYEMDGEDDDGDSKAAHPSEDPYMTAFLRHREWLLEHHRLLFFFASAYHERDMADEETLYYERAETIRQQVLKLPEQKFSRLSARAKDILDGLVINSKFTIPPSEHHGGIIMSRHLDELDSVRVLLNVQLKILGRWREDLVNRLTQPLLQDGEEGEQYQYSIDLQHTLESYLHFYSRMILLRKDFLMGTKDVIAKVVTDAESQRERESMVKRRENRVRRFRRVDGLEEPKAEDDLDRRLEKEMDALITPGLVSTLRSVRFDMKSLSSDLNMPPVERQMAEEEELRLKEEQDRQTKLIVELEKYVDNGLRQRSFDSVQISDTVRDIESTAPQEDITVCLQDELSQQMEVVRKESRLRYLQTIATASENGARSEEDRLRIVRRKLAQVVMSDQSLNCLDEKSGMISEDQSVDKAQNSLREGNLRLVPEAIRRTTIRDGYGSKIDSIVRHISYLVQNDPNVKCLVFSQWSDVLGLVGLSLDLNNIGHVKLDGASVKSAVKEFNDNKDKRVFMLHAKSQSAGLTLLSATHVFICEPLVNPVLQAQAVSRVHRIGQTKETFVHYYLIRDTIEIPCFELFERSTATRSEATNEEFDSRSRERSSSLSILASQVSSAQNRHGELVSLNDLRFLFRMQRTILNE